MPHIIMIIVQHLLICANIPKQLWSKRCRNFVCVLSFAKSVPAVIYILAVGQVTMTRCASTVQLKFTYFLILLNLPFNLANVRRGVSVAHQQRTIETGCESAISGQSVCLNAPTCSIRLLVMGAINRVVFYLVLAQLVIVTCPTARM